MFCIHFALSSLVALAPPGDVAVEPNSARTPVVRVVPEALTLGRHTPDSEVASSVWLVNTGEKTVTLTTAKSGCGCLELGELSTREITPGSALEVPVHAHVPSRDGEHKSARIDFLFADDTKLDVAVSMVADAEAPEVPTAEEHDLLAAAPAILALPTLRPKERHETAIWIVNTSEKALHVTAVEPGCGCTVVDFSPTTLLPGAALRIPLVVTAPARPGARKKVLRVFVEGAKPLRIPLTYEVTENEE